MTKTFWVLSFAVTGAVAWSTVSSAAEIKVRPLAGASVITGRVEAKKECDGSELEAWLSQDATLLYQVDVSQHGSFEFHVLPGAYELVITGSTGCFAEQKVEVAANQSKRIEIKPTKKSEPKHASLLDWFVGPAHADIGNCPYCGMMSYYQPSFYPQQPMPWWGPYGGMTYPGFGYPGPWHPAGPGGGPGVNGGYYPGTGGFAGAKPVLYLHGKDDTAVSVKVDLKDQGNWLVAIPAYGETAWQGKLRGNHIIADGNADFRYLFYDYRADPSALQDERGFCTKRADLIPRMKGVLKQLGFDDAEIKDFEMYWGVKIPPSKRYCVFPQQSRELDALAQVKIEPKPARFTQINFVIQVDEGLSGGPGKFTHAPKATWTPAASRAPAAAPDALIAREWGVGFLLVSDQK